MAGAEAWKALPAVEKGRVRFVDPVIWADGMSYGAAHTVLDQIEKLFEDPDLRD